MICIPKQEKQESSRMPGEPTYLLSDKGGPLEYISASRVNCWMSCRRKFYFRYVKKLTSPPSPALHVGKVVHSVLQDWNHARWANKPMARLVEFPKNFDQVVSFN